LASLLIILLTSDDVITPATNKLVGAKESRPLLLCSYGENYQSGKRRQGFMWQNSRNFAGGDLGLRREAKRLAALGDDMAGESGVAAALCHRSPNYSNCRRYRRASSRYLFSRPSISHWKGGGGRKMLLPKICGTSAAN
jgi:hypothetical protein